MSATMAEFSFAELLDANERETGKWQSWFEGQPAELLDLSLNIALAKNVREFLLHIFAVELRYAERLASSAITEYESIPTGSVRELFGIGEKARTLYRDYLTRATDEDLATVLEFPTRTSGVLRASKRKMFAHAMLHGVRHWAQLATALREAGHSTDWGHDFLFSDVMP
ncbi:MAG TPA: DinB family protein [Terriglobales bacterium]|jgi:uncharacterized damage-inducible protein DinB